MAALVAAVGADPVSYPEASSNFEDMIHSIHAGTTKSAAPDKFVRDRGTSGVYYYNFNSICNIPWHP